eukprot:2102442-Rhodomonas_salina.2
MVGSESGSRVRRRGTAVLRYCGTAVLRYCGTAVLRFRYCHDWERREAHSAGCGAERAEHGARAGAQHPQRAPQLAGPSPGIALRARYAMPGTDGRYGALPSGTDVWYAATSRSGASVLACSEPWFGRKAGSEWQWGVWKGWERARLSGRRGGVR